MKKLKDARLIGMAGEHRVISELLLRGYNPSVAVIDRGVDIILESGKSLQVKTTTQTEHMRRKGAVAVDISSTAYTMGRRGEYSPTDLRADCFVVWVVARDEFYIIPRKAIIAQGIRNCLSITPGLNAGFAVFKDRWDLLEREE